MKDIQWTSMDLTLKHEKETNDEKRSGALMRTNGRPYSLAYNWGSKTNDRNTLLLA